MTISERTLSTALGALYTARSHEFRDHNKYREHCLKHRSDVSDSMKNHHEDMIERYDTAIEEMEENDPIFKRSYSEDISVA